MPQAEKVAVSLGVQVRVGQRRVVELDEMPGEAVIVAVFEAAPGEDDALVVQRVELLPRFLLGHTGLRRDLSDAAGKGDDELRLLRRHEYLEDGT